MEVLKECHFSLQMGNCPIPVAEDSGHCQFQSSNKGADIAHGWHRRSVTSSIDSNSFHFWSETLLHAQVRLQVRFKTLAFISLNYLSI